uniref:FYVE-type domain-containing protein n=1 Tax=Hyaloperonospora arabidopsidis (strain Emoy2) TaxID=559515 RepID=M4C1X0_HYAAE
MTSETLPFPLDAGFFPQLVLTVEDLMHYRRSSKECVAQLVRVIDDADCVYRWTDLKASSGRTVHKAQFVAIQPPMMHVWEPSSRHVSTLFKCSVHIVDVQADEILRAIAHVKTREARRAMTYLHREEFDQVDTRTLLTFPASFLKQSKTRFSYRAIKWKRFFQAKRRDGQQRKSVDFCYLEYAGKKKKSTASARDHGLVGYCVQEAIDKDRQVPTLERYNVDRKQVVRSGMLITRTHQSNILKVTAIAQVDGSSAMGSTAAGSDLLMEEVLVDFVAAVHRVKGLLERQRIGRLQHLDEWEWIASKDRKACAVCLQRFYFHRKQHCVTCGEVVCSSCAPLRELEQPLEEQTHTVRVCSLCMAQAGSHHGSSLLSSVTEGDLGLIETASATTNVGTESYVEGLRHPKHPGMPQCSTEDPRYLRGSLSQATSVRSSLRQRQRQQPLSSRSSTRASATYDRDEGSRNGHYYRASSGHMSSERRSALLSTPLSAKAKKKALNKLVEHARHIRDTIDQAISEVEGKDERPGEWLERSYGGSDNGDDAEQYDEIYDRIVKIRETLDVSSSDLDAVLSSIGHNDPIRPSDANSDQCDSDLVFSFSEATGSEHPGINESFDLRSSCSSLSASVQSLDHQDAGEPLPSSTPEQESAIEEARALEEAMQWVRQSEPSANLRPSRIARPNEVGVQVELEVLASASTAALLPTSVDRASSTRGIERLAQKIGRLHERLKATQRERDASSNIGSTSTTGALVPVTPTFVDEPIVVDERGEHWENGELGADKRSIQHRPVRSSALKPSRGRAPRASTTKQVAILPRPALSSSSVVSRGSSARGSLLSDEAPSDLVASLRGVMNSSELSHAPLRRRPRISSLTSSPSPLETTSTAFTPSRQSSPGAQPPPPLPTARSAVHLSHSTRRASRALTVPVLIQSTLDHDGPPKGTEAESAMMLTRRIEDGNGEEGLQGNNDLVTFDGREEQRQRPSTGRAERPLIAISSSGRSERARDESRELRELMEGLARAPLRSRCSSGQSSGAPPTEKFDI